MLSKHARLSRGEFATTSTIPSVYNQLGTAKYAPATVFKAAVVTSGKHEKLAVSRNRLRRRVYDTLHRLDVLQPIRYTIVIYASKKSYKFSFEEVNAYTKDLVKKIRKNR